jgi:hypothetical protein
MIDETTTPLAAGIAQANAEATGTTEQETADVKKWLKRIEDARKFDEAARQRYAMDRQFARNDRGGFDYALPVAPTYVGIMSAFLYAKDPDLDVQPADGTTPPPMTEIVRMAREQVQADPATQQAMDAAAQGAQQQAMAQTATTIAGAISGGGQGDQAPAPPVDPQQAAQKGADAALQQLVKQKAQQLMAPYTRRLSEAKQFGQTISSVVTFLWTQAKLKRSAGKQIRSAFTCGPGWIKAAWQERMGKDPVMVQQLNDIQDNIARLAAGQMELSDGYCTNPDEKRAELDQLAAGIAAKVEVVVARGLVIDFVSAEDVQLPVGINMEDYLESPWLAHRIFMSKEDAKAAFPDLCGDGEDDKLCKATQYFEIKPRDTRRDDIGQASNRTAEDADRFRTGASPTGSTDDANVCVWEVQVKQTNQILTFIEGCDCYARAPYAPNPGTTRFYNLFLYAPTTVDGERHPQSLIERTEGQLEDMNRLYSDKAEFRRRTLPKTVFDETNLSATDAKKIAAGGAQEMVGVKPTIPGTAVNTMVAPIQYARFDPTLYDDSQTRAVLEMAWGIQEALASTIQTAKTATEAEIQQTGTETRTDFMRMTLDDMLTDLAVYTTEIALQKMSVDDVKRIAGPFAFWPEAMSIEDLSALVNVRIRAGSSGKPNTTAERQAWAQTMPVVQAAIVQVGQLRGSSPDEIADCIEALVAETIRRSGDNLDPEQFMPTSPDSGNAPMAPAPLFAAPTVVPNGATLQ